jgi:uncharacterized delta-60 repeat protein
LYNDRIGHTLCNGRKSPKRLIYLCANPYGPGTQGQDMTLFKYTPAGQLTMTQMHSLAEGDSTDDASALAVDAANSVYVAGKSYADDGTYDMVVFRLLANGQLDSSFGANGVAWDHDAWGSSGDDEGLGIALTSTGRIFVAGRAGDNTALWKYLPNGQLDTSFGGGDGVVLHDNAAGGNGADWANAIVLRENNVYLTGTSWGVGQYDMVIWQFRGYDGELLDYLVYQHQLNDTLDDVGSGISISPQDDSVVVVGRRGANPSAFDLGAWKYTHADYMARIADEIQPPESIANQVDYEKTWLLGVSEPSPATAVFYHLRVYGETAGGANARLFANEPGAVNITWKNTAGASLTSELSYTLLDTISDDPRVSQVRYFSDRPTATVTLGPTYTPTIWHNAAIPQTTPPDPVLFDLISGTRTLEVQQNLDGQIIIQYDDVGGKLVGFEVVDVAPVAGTPPSSGMTVGRRIPQPSSSDGCRAVLTANTVVNGYAAAWQLGETGIIYPIRPETDSANFEVTWYTTSLWGNCWPVEVLRYTSQWPTDPQKHVIDAGASPQPAGSVIDLRTTGSTPVYCGAEIMYQAGFNPGDPQPLSEIDSGFFQAQNPGYSVIRFDIDPGLPGSNCGDDVTFEVVASHDNKDAASVYAGVFNWDIGTQITDPQHAVDTPAPYHFGFLQAGQPYAPDIHTDSKQVIPVNISDVHGLIEMWWYQASRPTAEGHYAAGLHWPFMVKEYNCQWPAMTEQIVIASRLGAGAYAAGSKIYPEPAVAATFDASNQITAIGWNPNDEHAVLLPSGGSLKAFAVRDDNPWQLTTLSGHPYVLVKYADAAHPGLWLMRVHQVVAEDAQDDLDYTHYRASDGSIIPVVAGLPIYPIYPVNLDGSICKDDGVPQHPLTQTVGDAVWVDRSGTIWAIEAQDDVTGQPSSAQIFLWENWQDLCQPWRAFADYSGSRPDWLNGLCYDGGTAGNWCTVADPCGSGVCRYPYPITYRPAWPEYPPACAYPNDASCARPLQVGQAVDETGQCGSITVLHDSVGVRIIDHTVWVSVSYPDWPLLGVDLSDLPPHLYDGEIGGGLAWEDRIRHGYQGSVNLEFRGIMSERDRQFLYGLSTDPIYRGKIDVLYGLSRAQLTTPLINAPHRFVTVGDLNARPGWITLAFQNDDSCIGLPVSVEVWHVDCPPFKGSIRPIQPKCPFNERQILQFTGDVGGEPENLVFHWQYSADYNPADPGAATWFDYPTGHLPEPYRHGRGLNEILIEGASTFTLAPDQAYSGAFFLCCS